uniref:Uncharacterized protein n=1 Tax=Anguilla anguilla TaxID=7936 RepID=A0A0E9WLD9_ANGAN
MNVCTYEQDGYPTCRSHRVVLESKMFTYCDSNPLQN